MKTLSKYKDFLTNKGLYLENQKFWNDMLAGLGQEAYEEWAITKFANGEDFFDGNPIASALYSHINKAVRIIQIASSQSSPLIRAWLETAEYNSAPIKELVVVIQPQDEAYRTAISIISFFLRETNEKHINTYVRALNIFHKKAASLKKTVTTIHTVNPYGTDDLIKSTIRDIYKQGAKSKSQPFD